PLGGLLGFTTRALLSRFLFKECKGKVGIGVGVSLKNPQNVEVGKNVLIDDYASLLCRDNGLITLDDLCVIGRYSILSAKGAEIILKKGVNISSFCRVATETRVEIGESTLIAAYSYIGPSNHQLISDRAKAVELPTEKKGGVKIGSFVWIGAHTTVLDGVSIGEGSVIGAHSLVLEDIPPFSVAVGAPAKVVKQLK
ncbi:MAG: acyltransferase, partial [Candidatus Dadabacteria bacterium]